MGSGGAGVPISLDALTGASSTQSLGANSSSSLGISQQSDFDFVGVSCHFAVTSISAQLDESRTLCEELPLDRCETHNFWCRIT